MLKRYRQPDSAFPSFQIVDVSGPAPTSIMGFGQQGSCVRFEFAFIAGPVDVARSQSLKKGYEELSLSSYLVVLND